MTPRLLSLVFLLSFTAATVGAQSTAPADAAALAQGWALLAKGDGAGAAGVAAQLLSREPHNAAALALLVDAETARGGAAAGLAAYERWISTRRFDNAHVLRRIARATLAEVIVKQPNSLARVEALTALAADGDVEAMAKLEQLAGPKNYGETRSLAALGNKRAVEVLIGQLTTFPGPKSPIIDALGDSSSELAVPHVRVFLADPDPANRTAAATALGKLGARNLAGQIRALLNDGNFTVKLKAAGALLRLDDLSGLGLLSELSSSEHAGVRIAAAKELAARPDAAWQQLVRSLASDPDPAIRLEAAQLIAPYDHQLAASVVNVLVRDANVGIREMAYDVLVQRVASDFLTLRRLMQGGDQVIRARAAGKILEITRS